MSKKILISIILIFSLIIIVTKYSEYNQKKNIKLIEIKLNNEENIVRKKYVSWNNKNLNLKIIKKQIYFPGINIYSDRHYFNHENDKKLNNFILIQLPRHYQKSINISSSIDIVIYRAVCKKNKNNIYSNWKNVDFEIKIIGSSCVHSKLKKKKFNKGKIKLLPGGPISSDPIFIESGSNSFNTLEIIE